MKTMVAAGTAGMAMMTAGGWLGALGWILFVASVAWGIFQQTVINKLKDELKFERKQREILDTRVSEMKTRIDRQQQELMKGATERLELSREVEGMRKDMELMRQANEKNMATIAKLAEKYGDV
jgi:uncharacterized protein YlxW (UPF0749 family)